MDQDALETLTSKLRGILRTGEGVVPPDFYW